MSFDNCVNILYLNNENTNIMKPETLQTSYQNHWPNKRFNLHFSQKVPQFYDTFNNLLF